MALNVANLQQLASGMPSELQGSMGPVLRAQDKLNADISQTIGAPLKWQTPQLINGWSSFKNSARFTQINFGGRSLVVLAGAVQSGTLPGVIFQLPASMSPAYLTAFAVAVFGGTTGVCQVGTDGSVTANSGNNTLFFLDGCTFAVG